MTESSFRIAIDVINEIITFIWLTIAISIALIILVGQKIEAITMPTFRSLNFGQKPREEITAETEEINNGLLNRKIVVEKVKNVFGKTLKSKQDKGEDEDFDIKKVIKLFQSSSNKKSVTFADKDEVITVCNDILTEFETSTSFCEDEAIDKNENEVEDEEVKNLLFHEVDENFNPEEVKISGNYTNLGFWKNEEVPSDVITITIGESPKPPNEPPPLPPRWCQKFNPKLRPSIPPPLPPKTLENEPPAVRRDLKKSKAENMTVNELVENFIKLQESVSVENLEENSFSDVPKPLEEIKTVPEANVFNFDEYKPVDLPCANIDEVDCAKSVTPTFSTFKPDIAKKPDWKEAFLQPVNPVVLINKPMQSIPVIEQKPKISKIPVPEHSKPKVVKTKIPQMKSSKIPKLVEEIMGKSSEKKPQSFNSATLKKCNVKVSEIVNNFEQKGKSVKVLTTGSVEDVRINGDNGKKCHEPISDGNGIVGKKLDSSSMGINVTDMVSQGNLVVGEIEPNGILQEMRSFESDQVVESKIEVIFVLLFIMHFKRKRFFFFCLLNYLFPDWLYLKKRLIS